MPKRGDYAKVNAEWQGVEVGPLTFEEARKALRKLLRSEGLRMPSLDRIERTSGNRYNWPASSGRWRVNPDRGWHALVHDVSHFVHRRKHPNGKPHDRRHATIEARMRRRARDRGWLTGSLRPKPKPEPTPVSKDDERAEKIAAREAQIARLDAKIAAHESKIKALRTRKATARRSLAALRRAAHNATNPESKLLRG